MITYTCTFLEGNDVDIDKIAERIIRGYTITSVTSREEIKKYVEDYIQGLDDYLYYDEGFNNDDVKNKIITNIFLKASFIKPLIEDREKTYKLFEQMVNDYCLESRYNVSPELIQTIRILISRMKSNTEK